MQIRHLPRHCCPVLDNVGNIRLASLEYYTMSMRTTLSSVFISTPKAYDADALDWVEYLTETQINDDQFGCIKGSFAVDALVEIVHKLYEATDTLGTYVRILLLDFSKAFDRINHDILLEKLRLCGLPPHLLRWKAAFLFDRTQSE